MGHTGREGGWEGVDGRMQIGRVLNTGRVCKGARMEWEKTASDTETGRKGRRKEKENG